MLNTSLSSDFPSPSKKALRTLLTVLAVVIGVVIYAYGWNTTQISLDEVQDPVRQASVKRAMRELLSPDIFTRDHKRESFFVEFRIGCPAGELPDERAETGGSPYVIFHPPCADSDDIVTVEGHEFPSSAIARLQLVQPSGQNMPFKLASGTGEGASTSAESTFDVDGAGYFKINVKVPRGRGLSGQTHQLEIQTVSPTGWPRLSKTTETVIEKMVETIFLALMATTMALPVSVALSFIAARNLMRQITLQLGNVLVGFVLLPVGALIGALIFGPIGRQGVEWGRDVLPGIAAAAVALAALAGATIPAMRLKLTGAAARARAVALNVLLLAVFVLIAGVLGGLGIRAGRELQGNLLEDLGNFVGTLGELVDLSIAMFAAVGGAFWLASLGSTLAAGPLRHVYAPLSHILGAVLGTLSGVILLTSMAFVGAQAVLLTVLAPIVAAVLGGETLLLLVQRILLRQAPGQRLRSEQPDTERILQTVVFGAGAIITFIATALILDLVRAVVDQRLPSELTRDLGPIEVQIYILKAALIGGALGGIAGGLAGTQTPYPLGMTIYTTTRTILNTLRSIEPLIMGIVFVIWVGVGPFAGVLALTLHSIAALGKLYSEQVENIDSGPLEAIQATGANRLQTIVYAVVPQIVPPYIAFTMYRWDINVRMSTIIGFVGGGGIGFLLQQQINLLRYQQAGVAVLAIAIVVSVLDYASAAIREKIV